MSGASSAKAGENRPGRSGAGRGGASRLAAVLSLAAAPIFAAMAAVTALVGDGPMRAMCSPHGPAALSGMATMYALMSAFHLGPWLKVAARR